MINYSYSDRLHSVPVTFSDEPLASLFHQPLNAPTIVNHGRIDVSEKDEGRVVRESTRHGNHHGFTLVETGMTPDPLSTLDVGEDVEPWFAVLVASDTTLDATESREIDARLQIRRRDVQKRVVRRGDVHPLPRLESRIVVT